MSAGTETRRNAPCPCGSGERYKRCCGGPASRFRQVWEDPPTIVLEGENRPTPDPAGDARARIDQHGILMVDNFLSPRQCEHLVEASRGQLSKRGRVRVAAEQGSDLIDKDSDARITTTIKTFDIAHQVLPVVRSAFQRHVQPHYGVQFEWFEFPDILRYDPGGHYAAHNDSEVWDAAADTWRLAEDRQYSVLIYLNRDFAGGALHFPRYDFTVDPKPGLLLAFPSDHRYEHRAMPVEAGTRYVIVSWGAAVGAARVQEGVRLGVVYTDECYVPQRLREVH